MAILRDLVLECNTLERYLAEAQAEVERGGEWAIPHVERLRERVREANAEIERPAPREIDELREEIRACKADIRRLTEWSLAETMARFGG